MSFGGQRFMGRWLKGEIGTFETSHQIWLSSSALTCCWAGGVPDYPALFVCFLALQGVKSRHLRALLWTFVLANVSRWWEVWASPKLFHALWSRHLALTPLRPRSAFIAWPDLLAWHVHLGSRSVICALAHLLSHTLNRPLLELEQGWFSWSSFS